MTTPSTPLAIIGIGCLFPKANGLGAYWSLLKNGVDAITPIPPSHWNPADYFDADPKKPDSTYAQRGGFLDPYPFPPGEFGIAPNDIEATDTSQLLGMVAARMALDDAGYGAGREYDRSRVSVILGVTGTLELVVPLGARLGHPRWRRAMQESGVPEAQIADAVQRIGESYVGWQENSFPGLLGNVVAGRIANRLDLWGTNCVVDAACASSLSAVHLAGMELTTGKCDMVVTGGVDTFNDIFMYMCFSKTPALSPTGDARPFAANADGTILGEGLGMLVLKRLADAERDGDRIYAVIKGIGSSSDGKGNAVYAPSAAGQVRCLETAYQQAGISPTTIELAEAHGTGTKVGDATEIQALTQVFGASRERERPEVRRTPVAHAPGSPWCALGSVKSQIGHTKAAAGAAGLIKAALALYHKVLPPTIKADTPAEALNGTPFYLNTVKRPWLPHCDHPRRAAVSAFGFGGSNFHCVLEEYRSEKPAVDWDGDVQIIGLSADSLEELKGQWDQLNRWDSWNEIVENAAKSRATFSAGAEFRLVVVVQKNSNFGTLAKTVQDSLSGNPKAAGADGVYFGSGPVAGKLAVLFPGQGSQYIGMLRDLACVFPSAQTALADAELINSAPRRLSDAIFPLPGVDGDARTAHETALRATDVAQPAIGAVSLGALRILESFGVCPEVAAGHSYGELTALCAAGCFDTQTFHRLSQLRGRLMAAAGGAEAGSMLAVHADAETIERTLAESGLNVVVANRNAPAQTVVSGPTQEIDRAEKAFADRGIRVTRLPVAAAFHSPLVAGAARPFRDELERIAFAPPRFPVYANTTGRPYPSDARSARDLLGGQLAKPVEFVRTVTEMLAAGVRTFVEVGPGHTLSRLIEATLKEQGAEQADAFALDSSAGKRSGVVDLAHALARLATRGHPVRLAAWEENPAHPRTRRDFEKPTLTVPICGANYVKPRPNRPARSHTPAMNGRVLEATPAAPLPPAGVRPTLPSSRIAYVAQDPPKQVPPPPALPPVLQLARDGLTAFQQLQQQTAELHRQFLQGQEAAQQALHRLIEQQQQLMLATLGAGRVPAAAPSAPAPPLPAILLPRQPEPSVKPMAAPAVMAAPVLNSDKVQNVLLAVVAEKTGYPAEMLDLNMGLDADLGIDSIKRVEILSALQERLPDAPTVKPEHLGTLNTLREIVAFLAAGSGASAPAPAAPVSRSESDVQRVLLEVVSEKTGYPVEMLDPHMGLDADLGIDSIKRVEILSVIQERLHDAPAVKPEHLGTLNTLSEIVTFLSNGHAAPEPAEKKKADPAACAPSERVTISRLVPRTEPLPPDARATLPLPKNGAIWLVSRSDALAGRVAAGIRARGHAVQRWDWSAVVPAEVPHDLCGLILLAPTGELSADFAPAAFRWLRGCAVALRRAGGVLRTVTRLGGGFGLNGVADDCDPVAGGIAGLVKTAHHEWPEVSCRALDFAPADADSQRVAAKLVDEIFCQGPAEVGVTPAGLTTVALTERPLPRVNPKLFGASDFILISGGARGVTAEAALALAQAYRPALVLLGRSPAPGAEPQWLADATDETDIRRRIGANTPGATPKEIGRQFRDLMAAREIRETLAKLRAAGSRVAYRSLDVREPDAVTTAVAQARNEFGPVTALIHGAGVIEDRLIVDKTDDQFARVFGTKVDGLRNLLRATANDPVRAIALFSSSTGRFGRAGQADYAVANEVLNKLAQREAKRRSGCRVVAVNWGPWDGGMVSPALAKAFAREGIGLIPAEDGAQFILAELSDAAGPAEVVAGVWGSGGPPVSQLQATAESAATPFNPVFERLVSIERMPVLASHVIGGRAVLPLALHLEWLAHAAMHGNPGLTFRGLDNVRVLNGVIVPPNETRTVRGSAGKSQKRDGAYFVPAELRGSQPDGRDLPHSRAVVVLATSHAAEPQRIADFKLERFSQSIHDAYGTALFHGTHLHGIARIEGVADEGIVGVVRTAPEPSRWLAEPLRNAWLADPLVLDSAFQLLVLWGVSRRGEPNLPVGVGRYRQFSRTFPSGEIHVVARITKETAHLIHADVELLDGAGALVGRLENAEFVGEPGLQTQFRQNRISVPA